MAGAAKKRPSEADLTGGAADRQKKKRKRKPKLPKGFDPENPGPAPDPERWLPKWQRSDFKKKRNRRREQASQHAMQQSVVWLWTGNSEDWVMHVLCLWLSTANAVIYIACGFGQSQLADPVSPVFGDH